MPISKQAIKQMRVSARKQGRNKSVRSVCKTEITKAEKAISTGNADAAKQSVLVAISTLDKAAERGVLHPNNAARRKSRLMKKLNKAAATAAPAK